MGSISSPSDVGFGVGGVVVVDDWVGCVVESDVGADGAGGAGVGQAIGVTVGAASTGDGAGDVVGALGGKRVGAATGVFVDIDGSAGDSHGT